MRAHVDARPASILRHDRGGSAAWTRESPDRQVAGMEDQKLASEHELNVVKAKLTDKGAETDRELSPPDSNRGNGSWKRSCGSG